MDSNNDFKKTFEDKKRVSEHQNNPGAHNVWHNATNTRAISTQKSLNTLPPSELRRRPDSGKVQVWSSKRHPEIVHGHDGVPVHQLSQSGTGDGRQRSIHRALSEESIKVLSKMPLPEKKK